MTESITRTVLAEVVLPQPTTVQRVETLRIRLAAGTVAGLHVHNCPVVGSISEGSVAYQIEGEPVTVLRPGDAFYEPAGARIARFDALDDDVTFVAHFLLTDGQRIELDFPTD